jgi:ribonuclease R
MTEGHMKNKQDIEKMLIRYFNDGGAPGKILDLAKALDLPPGGQKMLRNVIRDMTEQGTIKQLRGLRFGPVESTETTRVIGTLTVNVQGFGFVSTGPERSTDIFIPAARMNGARHKDRVEVEVSRPLMPSHGRQNNMAATARLEGTVVEVLNRGIREVVGLLFQSPAGWKLTPDDARLPGPILIRDTAPNIKMKDGDKVVVLLLEATLPGALATGRVIEVLGAADQPGIDILSVMRQHQLQEEFPEEVMQELGRIKDGLTAADLKGRMDLRDQLIFTIDPVDAKDFDDAVSIDALPNGNWRIGIHIADVTHYVKPGTHMDREGMARGNSAYLVDRVVPMLPHRLTNDLCSLVPHQDRLTHSAFVEVTPEGLMLGYETARTVIHSKARLTYGMVQDFFTTGRADSHIPAKVVAALMQMRPIARAIRARRFAAGALEVHASEVKCILKRDGKVERIEKREGMEAYQLIEEFMLLANLAVGDSLRKATNQPGIYRIHEAPSETQWRKMEAELALLGIETTMAHPSDINKVFHAITEPHLKFPVTVTILKNLKRATYSSKLDMHFGLAFECYTHFTSPIRRYPDLIVHRLLNAIEDRKPARISEAEMHELAMHCSGREQNAEEAETATVAIKMVEYYHDRLKAGDAGPYDACITGFNPRGIMIELVESLQRGMVPFETLKDDYYMVNPSGTKAEGRRTGRVLRLGDAASVIIAQVDTRLRRIEFSIVGDGASSSGRKPHAGGSRKPSRGGGGKPAETAPVGRTSGGGRNRGRGRKRR